MMDQLHARNINDVVAKEQTNLQHSCVDKALRAKIVSELSKSGTSLTSLAKDTGVHKSQITRFKQGAFTRLSPNLQKICRKLQINMYNATCDDELTSAVHAAWDGSTASKRQLIAILTALQNWDRKEEKDSASC